MKPKLSDLWRWHGEITRGVFVLWAIILFIIEYKAEPIHLRVRRHGKELSEAGANL